MPSIYYVVVFIIKSCQSVLSKILILKMLDKTAGSAVTALLAPDNKALSCIGKVKANHLLAVDSPLVVARCGYLLSHECCASVVTSYKAMDFTCKALFWGGLVFISCLEGLLRGWLSWYRLNEVAGCYFLKVKLVLKYPPQ